MIKNNSYKYNKNTPFLMHFQAEEVNFILRNATIIGN